MCGIVGAYHFDRSFAVSERDVRGMGERIVHRGPDDGGYFTSGNVGLGMRRLSIIDLAGGHQPIFSEDGSRVIVFNGELYNYREQAKALAAKGYTFRTASDTEVVLALSVTLGDAFLAELNGMFGFALLDRTSNRLTLVRDRLGIKPLYYYQDDEKLVFASEVKALLAYPGVAAELDADMVPVFFRHGFVPAPRTLFRRIRKLEPGGRLDIDGHAVKTSRYWDVEFADKHGLGATAVLEQLSALLDSAVTMQMVSDVPLGAFLSGGLDSSGIVHLMGEHTEQPVNTYSIGFGGAFSVHDESEDAARFARDYRTNHHAITVTPDVAELIPRLIKSLDEPLADSSFIVTYLVSALASETVKVILSGVGGDEIFSGYRRYLFAGLDRYVGLLPGVVRQRVLPGIANMLPADRSSRLMNATRLAKGYLEAAGKDPVARYAQYVSVLQEDRLAEFVRATADGAEDPLLERMSACDASSDLDKAMYFDLKGSLPEQLLMLTDKMTMATSLEARVPYLDHRLVEFMARTDPALRIKGLELRYLQKQYLRPRIPAYVLKRRKKGFGAPFGAWIRSDLLEQMRDYLSPSRLQAQGILEPRIANAALEAHLARREDFSDFLLANLSFQVWYEAYIEGARVPAAIPA